MILFIKCAKKTSLKTSLAFKHKLSIQRKLRQRLIKFKITVISLRERGL